MINFIYPPSQYHRIYSFTALKKKAPCGVPIVEQRKGIPLVIMRLRIRSLASLSGLRMRCCHELWCRLAAVAPIRPLAWKPPYATGATPKEEKKKKNPLCFTFSSFLHSPLTTVTTGLLYCCYSFLSLSFSRMASSEY